MVFNCIIDAGSILPEFFCHGRPDVRLMFRRIVEVKSYNRSAIVLLMLRHVVHIQLYD